MTLAYRLSAALAILLFVAAVGGLFVPGLYRDTPLWAAQAHGVNLVDLVFALPTLVVSMVLSASASLRARIVWLGVLGYVLYNAVIFAFDIAFNPLFLIDVALLSLATFSLIVALPHLDVAGFRLRFFSSTPVRSVSVYLVIVAVLFFLAGILLVLNSLLSLSIVSSTLFQHANDRSISLAVVPMFGAVALVSVGLAILYLRSFRSS